MTRKEFDNLIKALQDCDAYLAGQKHSEQLQQLTSAAARAVVLERRNNLIERLGVTIVDEEV